nr:MAG TPA: hypothetical protein [Caudoviricetes sp.]
MTVNHWVPCSSQGVAALYNIAGWSNSNSSAS